jgi:hypothetical protein
MDKQQMTDHDLLIRIDERTEETREDMKECMTRQGKHDTRIRRIETWFVPVLAFLSVLVHKAFEWLNR